MKKLISSIVTVAVLFPMGAFALTVNTNGGTLDCSSGLFTAGNGATSTESTSGGVCHPSGGDPLAVVQAWGLTGHQEIQNGLTVSSGTVVKDAAGLTFDCPYFYGYYGCVNLTSLDYYKNQARTIAKETNGVGLYSYWLTH